MRPLPRLEVETLRPGSRSMAPKRHQPLRREIWVANLTATDLVARASPSSRSGGQAAPEAAPAAGREAKGARLPQAKRVSALAKGTVSSWADRRTACGKAKLDILETSAGAELGSTVDRRRTVLGEDELGAEKHSAAPAGRRLGPEAH